MKNLVLFSVIIVIALGVYYYLSSFQVSVEEAKSLVRQGAVLLDVRTVSEYESGHIEGAINIPVHELTSRMFELADKSRPIVVYCRSGRRSSRAKQLLEDGGFQQVENLGGMYRWQL